MKEKLLLDIYRNATDHYDGESLLDDLELSTDRYMNLQEIDSGGMKLIYKCTDSHTDREIVLMTPKEESMYELFVREGRINAFLQHPGISPVYDIGILENGKPYFTSKLISGSQLRNLALIEDHDRAVDIVIKICEAVSYAHSRAVVHQDLKPENIMIDDFGEVNIIDWGLLKLMTTQSVAIVPFSIKRWKNYCSSPFQKKVASCVGLQAS